MVERPHTQWQSTPLWVSELNSMQGPPSPLIAKVVPMLGAQYGSLKTLRILTLNYGNI